MNANETGAHLARGMILGVIAMVAVVAASNYLVQFPVTVFPPGWQAERWLTWGAITYPAAFFVTDLANRAFGPTRARQIVYAGFAAGVALSIYLATWRIALASGTAFLVGQLLDITVFNRLRRMSWWKAPFVGSAMGSVIDTALFFSLAFAGTRVPWVSLAQGDLLVKLALALLFLAPFRALMNSIAPLPQAQAS
jgi:uncharacterized PurR-regulated membrane protein YhhQ (DUF165 family)